MFKFFIVFHTFQNNPNNFQQISQNKQKKIWPKIYDFGP
jgi:hypothetical protein